MRLAVCHALAEGSEDGWCYGALLWGEEGVAAGEGEAVSLAHDGAGADGQTLGPSGLLLAVVSYHGVDDGYLLEVFLAEVGSVGFDKHEELAHYLAYAVEVARAECSFHDGVGGRI